LKGVDLSLLGEFLLIVDKPDPENLAIGHIRKGNFYHNWNNTIFGKLTSWDS